MTTKQKRLPSIPDYRPGVARTRKRRAAPASSTVVSPPVDLSYIAEDLRPLAVPVGEVEFLPVNPRAHGEKDLAALASSLKEFGQVKPVVVNVSVDPPQVVAGNGTLRATLTLGRSHIAVVRLKLTPGQAAAYAAADNALSAMSWWDQSALAQTLTTAGSLIDAMPDVFAGLKQIAFPSPATPGARAPQAPAGTSEPDDTPDAGEGGMSSICPECGQTLPE